MDKQTSDHYSANAAALAENYDSIGTEGISRFFKEAFEPDMKILDIGCGSGRDLRILHDMGYQADGIDSCPEFIAYAKQHKSGYATAYTVDSLPNLKSISDSSYDGILCSAVIQHLPEEEILDTAFTLRRILRKNGLLLLSLPLQDETIDPKTRRDPNGRLFNGLAPEQIQLLLERIGFKLIRRHTSHDSLKRKHRQWAVMIFALEQETGKRPVDTSESILNRDAKVQAINLPYSEPSPISQQATTSR